MFYTLLNIIGATLALTIVSSFVILHAAVQDKTLRKLLRFFVIITIPIAILAIIKTIFFRTKTIPYSAELGKIEDEIEKERAKNFGCNVINPSFSEQWRVSYMYALEKGAAAAARIDPSLKSFRMLLHFTN
jgi:hypothetical protein